MQCMHTIPKRSMESTCTARQGNEKSTKGSVSTPGLCRTHSTAVSEIPPDLPVKPLSPKFCGGPAPLTKPRWGVHVDGASGRAQNHIIPCGVPKSDHALGNFLFRIIDKVHNTQRCRSIFRCHKRRRIGIVEDSICQVVTLCPTI